MVARKRAIVLAVLLALGLAVLGAKMFLWKRPEDAKQVTTQMNAPEETNPAPQRAEPDDKENLPADQRERQAFARSMSKIHEGMAEKDVLALLGKPDDIRTDHDPGGIPTTHTKEIWRYGTNGHLTFATLGSIYIDADSKAQYVYGGGGQPPDPKTIPEAKLRSLLRSIDKAPSHYSGYQYNPLPVIQIVNALQPLGKDNALAAIDEYLRVASHFEDRAREGVFLVLRVLFDVPADPGHMPPMLVGAPDPEEPKDPKRLPRFPILLQDDVPLLLVWGYSLGGHAEPPERHVQYFRKHGRLRDRPLVPTNAPLGLLDSWNKNAGWLYTKDRRLQGKLLIANQILNMLDSVYRLEPDYHGFKFWPTKDVDDRWKTIEAEAAKLDIHWNAKKQRYTFKDDTYLPDPIRKIYRRHIWKLEGLNGEAELILERTDKKHVLLALTWSGKTNQKTPPLTVEVFAVKEKSKKLVGSRAIGSIGGFESGGGTSSYSFPAELAEGEEIQVRLNIGKDERLSPIYRP